MRVFALTLHLLSTGMLIWTKFDSIQVAMVNPKDNEEYESFNTSYMALLGFGIVFIFFELGSFLAMNSSVLTLGSVVHFNLDILACFFNFWIALDGLSWYTYLNVWVFCVLLPALYDMVILFVSLSQMNFVTRNHRGVMERLYTWWYGKPAAVTD